jgi:hypothetical protein
MTALGGEVPGEARSNIGQPDFSAIATEIAAQDPKSDVVMTWAYKPDARPSSRRCAPPG